MFCYVKAVNNIPHVLFNYVRVSVWGSEQGISCLLTRNANFSLYVSRLGAFPVVCEPHASYHTNFINQCFHGGGHTPSFRRPSLG